MTHTTKILSGDLTCTNKLVDILKSGDIYSMIAENLNILRADAKVYTISYMLAANVPDASKIASSNLGIDIETAREYVSKVADFFKELTK
jgi:hypothetical protein